MGFEIIFRNMSIKIWKFSLTHVWWRGPLAEGRKGWSPQSSYCAWFCMRRLRIGSALGSQLAWEKRHHDRNTYKHNILFENLGRRRSFCRSRANEGQQAKPKGPWWPDTSSIDQVSPDCVVEGPHHVWGKQVRPDCKENAERQIAKVWDQRNPLDAIRTETPRKRGTNLYMYSDRDDDAHREGVAFMLISHVRKILR